MDHGEFDKRFCVYLHINKDGDVVYVGSGTERRATEKASRVKEHTKVFEELESLIIYENLTKEDSIAMELKAYMSLKDKFKLFNKKVPAGNNKLIYEDLKEQFYYDPSSPSCLRHKIDKRGGNGYIVASKDSVAGSLSKNGYYQVKLKCKSLKAHRIVMCLCLKQDISTELLVDHIDLNKANNLISNLRLVTPWQNSLNKPLRKDNKTGVSGVKLSRCLNKDGTIREVFEATWRENLKHVSKCFNPKTLYPNMEYKDARELALNDAIAFRNEMIRIHHLLP